MGVVESGNLILTLNELPGLISIVMLVEVVAGDTIVPRRNGN